MRLQINVSDDLVPKIDEYAKQIGVSRSALCAMFIGQGIMSYDKSNDVISKMSSLLADKLDSALSIENK